jgi:hypothetical protein
MILQFRVGQPFNSFEPLESDSLASTTSEHDGTTLFLETRPCNLQSLYAAWGIVIQTLMALHLLILQTHSLGGPGNECQNLEGQDGALLVLTENDSDIQ